MIIHAQTVKGMRLARGWTQQQLADVAGLSLRTIQRVENQGQGSMETCNALCASLQVAREQLVQPLTPRSVPTSGQLGLMIAAGTLGGFVCGVVLMLLVQ